MKYILLTISIFYFTIAFSQTKLNGKTVIEKFYSTYNVTSEIVPQVEFEKRNENWYVKKYELKDSILITSTPILFYDALHERFENLQFPKYDTLRKVNYTDYIDEGFLHNFNVQPNYNYLGWYNDIINLYSTRKDLSDDQLYSIGRAYSNKATAKLTNQFNDVLPEESYNLPLKNNPLNKKQEADFIKNQDSAIYYFKLLSQRNKNFKTLVGSIQLKYANEIMVKFHALLSFSDSWKYIKLPEGLYSDSVLNLVEYQLKNSPNNSLLLSFGDSDFYPFLYLQHSKKMRQDVYVINYNLLFKDKYTFRYTFPQFNAHGLKITSDTTMYLAGRNEYIHLYDDGKREHLSVSSILQMLQKNKSNYKPITLSSKNIKLIRPNGDNLNFKLNGSFLTKEQWILLDILNSDKRPLVLTYFFTNQLEGLNNFIRKEDNNLFLILE